MFSSPFDIFNTKSNYDFFFHISFTFNSILLVSPLMTLSVSAIFTCNPTLHSRAMVDFSMLLCNVRESLWNVI